MWRVTLHPLSRPFGVGFRSLIHRKFFRGSVFRQSPCAGRTICWERLGGATRTGASKGIKSRGAARIEVSAYQKLRSAWPKRKREPCAAAALTASAPSSCQATGAVARPSSYSHYYFPQCRAWKQPNGSDVGKATNRKETRYLRAVYGVFEPQENSGPTPATLQSSASASLHGPTSP